MNMLRTIGLLLPLAATAAWADTGSGTREAEQVAAFARLYGVVRHFHPGDALREIDWNRFAVYGAQQAQAAPGRRALGPALRELFAPIAAGVQILPEDQPYPPAPPAVQDHSRVLWQHLGYADGVSPYSPYQAKRTHRAGLAATYPATPTPPGTEYDAPEAVLYPVPEALGRVVDFSLGDGWKARVPLDLAPADAVVTPAQRMALDALKARMEPSLPPAGATSLTPAQREADVLVAWNVLRHFYPYWVDLDTDWDAQLVPLLREAGHPADRAEQRDTLRRLMALAQDGHAQVSDRRQPSARLPVLIEPMEGQLVITASRDPAAKPGDRIVAIDGMPAKHWLDREIELASGYPQWRPWRAAGGLTRGPKGQALALRIERDGNRFEITLHYDSASNADLTNAVLPPSIAELRPRVWYVDLGRIQTADIEPYTDRLAQAEAIVFDMRGYPKGDAPLFVLRHLLDHEEHATWMHIDQVDGPFQRLAGRQDEGWGLKPQAPRFRGRIAFLSGGGAISFADSVLGYVTDEHLGTLVGSPSAGTNGNIQAFTTPGDYFVVFTGMRVTRHDGHSRFHLLGAIPDVPAEQTIAGFRAGRDEVIERALRGIRVGAGFGRSRVNPPAGNPAAATCPPCRRRA